MGEELNSLSLIDLRELAKQKGIKGVSKLNKEALIEAIMQEHNDSKKEENAEENVKVEQAEMTKKPLAEASQPGDYFAVGVL